jgi:hypothetical protein
LQIGFSGSRTKHPGPGEAIHFTAGYAATKQHTVISDKDNNIRPKIFYNPTSKKLGYF